MVGSPRSATQSVTGPHSLLRVSPSRRRFVIIQKRGLILGSTSGGQTAIRTVYKGNFPELSMSVTLWSLFIQTSEEGLLTPRDAKLDVSSGRHSSSNPGRGLERNATARLLSWSTNEG